MLLCSLVKHKCKSLRNESSLVDINNVMTEHDYDEALKAKFDTEIQSEAFGFNHTLSI